MTVVSLHKSHSANFKIHSPISMKNGLAEVFRVIECKVKVNMMYIYALGIIVFLCIFVIAYFIKRKNEISKITEFSSCRNPNCVRCVQYRQVTVRACERYHQFCQLQTDISDATQRIAKSLTKNSLHSTTSQLQEENVPNPLVFDLKELNPTEFYEVCSDVRLAADITVLEENKDTILSDFLNINKPQHQERWLRNDTPEGQWRVFHLINQGKVMEENIKLCEKTFELVSKLQNVMKRNVFGNVVFSVINPGTTISTHYGPTNIRIRCHLGLITMDECILTVSGMHRKWQTGKCLLFNDAFPHGVTHLGSDEKGPRCVPIVDLWHPDITMQERNSIDYIFSPVNE